MKIDPLISAIPFVNIGNVNYYKEEQKILFSVHSVFGIGQMKPINGNDRLWQVDLELTSDNDPQRHILTEYMRKETFTNTQESYRLGNLLIKLGQFDKA